MNLREQLKEILPECLPKSAAESIKGTELIHLVRLRLKQKYSDATLRYHFSVMSCDPTSPIAKVNQGQGYFLREAPLPEPEDYQETLGLASELFEPEEPAPQREGGRRWHTFQALYERIEESGRQHVFPVRQLDLQTAPRQYFWTVPDSSVVTWNAGRLGDRGFEIRDEFMAVLEMPYHITSTTLVLGINYQNFRQSIFQCLSTSQWAHSGELVIAAPVTDFQLAEELSRLGSRFGLGISSYGMRLRQLDHWSAHHVRQMSDEEIERMHSLIDRRRFSAPRPGNPDWNHLSELCEMERSFHQLFQWLHWCRRKGKAISYSDYLKSGV